MGEPPHIYRLSGYFLDREQSIGECVSAMSQSIAEGVKDLREFAVPIHSKPARVVSDKLGQGHPEDLVVRENLGPQRLP
jgi:hypothetical protein